jgi:hypothetical protein
MADLAAALARAAAARALAAERGEPDDPAERGEPGDPQAADPQPPPAAPRTSEPHAATRPRDTDFVRLPSCKAIHPALLFIRLVATMRACITLEARLAAAAAPAAPRAPRADPRREILREAFRHVTQNRPDRAEQLRELDTGLDALLEADPAQTRDVPEILCTTCDERGIDIDFARLPDKFLRRDPAMQIAARIEHRANYPP